MFWVVGLIEHVVTLVELGLLVCCLFGFFDDCAGVYFVVLHVGLFGFGTWVLGWVEFGVDLFGDFV